MATKKSGIDMKSMKATNEEERMNEEERKRKREQSSTSELETSATCDKLEDSKKAQKKKKKDDQTKSFLESGEVKKSDLNSITKQIQDMSTKLDKLMTKVDNAVKDLNKKMANVLLKDDDVLKSTIKSVIDEMKEDLMNSMCKQIEILEGRLFVKESENESLSREIESMKKDIKEQQSENERLYSEIERNHIKRKEFENRSEQYSRRNNIRIVGKKDENARETAEITTTKVIAFLKEKLMINIGHIDVDIAHRLPNKTSTNRDIIVKFHSRMLKDKILRSRKILKNSSYFINEDLTRENQRVLMCVKRKMNDEVVQTWTQNGTIYYRNKLDKTIEVKYDKYKEWNDLPWP